MTLAFHLQAYPQDKLIRKTSARLSWLPLECLNISMSQVSAAARSRTIALIVGAGASIPCGAPSTKELLDIALNSFPSEWVTIDAKRNETRRAVPLAALIRQHIVTTDRGEADFELVMACIEEMISYDMPGRILRTFTQPRASFEPVLHPGMLQAAYESAIRSFVTTFLFRVKQSPQHAQAAASLTRLVQALAADARVVLSTLNYDTILDDALLWADGFTQVLGWDFSEFQPRLWLERRSDQHLLMHLHGSMRFGFRPAMALYGATPSSEPVRYSLNASAAESVLRSSSSSPAADGLLLPATPIIVGGHKSPKLIHNVRPYAYYNATALEEISKADALLIIGYGFRDEHVNAWIDEYLRLRPGGPLAFITKRTGADVRKANAVERFLMRLCGGLPAYDEIYETVDGGHQSTATNGRFGSSYVVTSGVPLDHDTERGVLAYLLNEEPIVMPFAQATEYAAYFGRRARVLRRDGSTLVGKIRDPGGARVSVGGKKCARSIRYADIIKIEPVPDDIADTD